MPFASKLLRKDPITVLLGLDHLRGKKTRKHMHNLKVLMMHSRTKKINLTFGNVASQQGHEIATRMMLGFKIMYKSHPASLKEDLFCDTPNLPTSFGTVRFSYP